MLVLVHPSVSKRDSWLIPCNITGITDADVSKIRTLRLELMNAEVFLNFELTIVCCFDADEACIVPPVLSILTLASLPLT